MKSPILAGMNETKRNLIHNIELRFESEMKEEAALQEMRQQNMIKRRDVDIRRIHILFGSEPLQESEFKEKQGTHKNPEEEYQV